VAGAPGWVQALVLGIVQGLTEFIPVSSSAHLVLVPALAGWERHGLAFDVALHLGTLSALLVYYRRDLWRIALALLGRGASPGRSDHRRLLAMLVVASLPVAAAGLLLGEAVESVFDAPVATAWLLFGTAAVLIAGERLHRRRLRHAPGSGGIGPDHRDPLHALEDGLGWRSALAVGVAQAFALLPGFSRSGLTISAGIAAGLPRSSATRFAFLLGVPAIAGAAAVRVPQVDDIGTVSMVEMVIGVGSAALSSYLAVAVLVRLVGRIGIDRFAWYVVPVAIASLWILR